jgi:hypothetical protein
MPFELFNCPEMLLARRTTGLHDLVLRVHERVQIVTQYFFPDRAQKLRLFHDFDFWLPRLLACSVSVMLR